MSVSNTAPHGVAIGSSSAPVANAAGSGGENFAAANITINNRYSSANRSTDEDAAAPRAEATLLVLGCSNGLPGVRAEAEAVHKLHPTGKLLIEPSASTGAAVAPAHNWAHFCGHADPRLGTERVLVWCNEYGGYDAVEASTLVSMMHGKQLVVLNGCKSADLGTALVRAGVRHVVCWETKLDDDAGAAFAEGFWRAMVGHAADEEVQVRAAVGSAFVAGRNAVLTCTRPQPARAPGALNIGGGKRQAATTPMFMFADPDASELFVDGRRAAGVPLLLLTPTRFIGVPPLPDHYLSRPGIERDMRNALLSNERRTSTVAITPATTISGAAGLVKTTIAAWLAWDTYVWSRFADGIVWLRFGQKARALELLRELAEALSMSRDDVAALQNERQAVDELRKWLGGLECLVVLDDVWRTEQVEPFKKLCGPTGSSLSLLLTSRLTDLGVQFGELQPLAPLSSAHDGLRLLAYYSGKSESALQAEGAERLVERCDGLPVMLRSVAALLRSSGRSVKFVLQRLDAAKKFRVPNVPCVVGYEYSTLWQALEVSLQVLEGQDEQAALSCRKLSVTLEDTPMPLSVLARLWGIDELEDVEECAMKLHNWRLVEREGQGEHARVSLLDLHRDYLRCRESNSLAQWQAALLRACGLTKVPDGGYWSASRFLGHFLEAAPRLSIASLNSLTRLDLDFNQIGDAGMTAFAEALSNASLNSLQVLWLSDNQIGDEGMLAFSNAFSIASLNSLQNLWLSNNQIGDEGMLAFSKALSIASLNSLRVLYLSGNKASLESQAGVREWCMLKRISLRI